MENVEQRIKELKKNWKDAYIWEDKPGEIYNKHSHKHETQLIIIKGSMNLVIENKNCSLIMSSEIIIKKGNFTAQESGLKVANIL